MANTKGSTIGAKVLRKEEIEQSLPTYEKLQQQIEAVRQAAKEMREHGSQTKTEFTMPQVINNFAILGKRGTGKSSILKTLYQDLESQNENKPKALNILLPTIVPENLGDNVSLMGCVLGLLKETVDQLCKSKEKKNTLCLPEVYPLRKNYNELMREFVQLQQPYEQISVQQFSSDSEYVRTMTSMLEAGNQFTVRFRNFIDNLLGEYEKESLLFIFIDDIDLSTNRCGDLVKTLLSYLSHPSIVTVLAGDIAIFGEALTVDFLHREQLPDSAFMEKIYLVENSRYGSEAGGENMLERKKQLAYEYLKKVMPPNNRHTIVNWSLRSKRNFRFAQEGEESEEVSTLGALLSKLDDRIPMLHNYFEGEKADGEQQDALLYYPFDTTARGLVSSYQAVRTLAERLETDGANPDNCYAEIKFLIEAVVASSYELSVSRQLIFEQFLNLGTTREDSTVRFDNFAVWLEQELPEIKNRKASAGEESDTTSVSRIEAEIRAFRLFVFLDWSARLLGKNELLEEVDYQAIKEKMLLLLCMNEYINEGNRCMSAQERVRFQAWRNRKESDLATVIQAYCVMPFPAAVRYFQSFDCAIFLDGKSEPSALDYTEYAVRYVDALNAYYGSGTGDLGKYMKEHQDMLSLIENFLRLNKQNMALSMLCDEYFRESSELYKDYIFSGCVKDGTKENRTIWFRFGAGMADCFKEKVDEKLPVAMNKYIENVLEAGGLPIEKEMPIESITCAKEEIYKEWMNMLRENIRSNKLIPFYNAYMRFAQSFFEENGLIQKLSKYSKMELDNIIENNAYEDGFLEKIKIILKVDEKSLWNIDKQFFGEENFIELIRKYIVAKLKISEKCFQDDFVNLEIGIAETQTAYDKFMQSYDGTSNTVATKCKRDLRRIVAQQDSENRKEKLQGYITTTQYIACILVLNRLIYSTAWYGKKEARQLRDALEKCSCDMFDSVSDMDLLREYFFWLHCYCRYREPYLADSAYQMLERAALAMASVEGGIDESDKQQEADYGELFIKQLGMDSLQVNDFYRLFRTGN